jgi:UDP-2,3-diacylglucosamine pyrophosphatase LpxH
MFDQPFYRRPGSVFLEPEPAAPPEGAYLRLIVPDSHGEHVDWGFANAMISDVEKLAPDIKEVIWLGDHLDCGGTFNAHQRNYTHERAESYQAAVHGARRLLTMVRERTPFASHDYLEGNHEQHVERFLARNFSNFQDAEFLLDLVGPRNVLKLDQLDIRYHRSSEMHDGLAVPGTIKRGRCYFTHGFAHSKNAAQTHLDRVGGNVVHGHTHRAQTTIQRTVESSAMGAWCTGTLAKLQPLYRHTSPTSWTGGYAWQFVQGNGRFTHVNVPLFGKGQSGLGAFLSLLKKLG